MSEPRSRTISEAIQRLNGDDSTLQEIIVIGDNFRNNWYTDRELAELIECLLQHPNIVTRVSFHNNLLTDKMGIKLAQYVATSTTIEDLDLRRNWFGEATYRAMAAALGINTSLRHLSLSNNKVADKRRIESVFIDTLMVNPNRPSHSCWCLFDSSDDYQQLKDQAEQLGHPNMRSIVQLGLF